MKKAAAKLRWKIWDLITEAHWKIANFLVQNFGIIFLPELETGKLSTKQNRKLRTKSVKAMLTWSHYKFKLRLEHLANKAGVVVLPICEAYTSKTVNWTGLVNHKLGGAKFVRDGSEKMDRDLNGALGVFLKGIAGYGLDGSPSCIC
jgi:putative transposase